MALMSVPSSDMPLFELIFSFLIASLSLANSESRARSIALSLLFIASSSSFQDFSVARRRMASLAARRDRMPSPPGRLGALGTLSEIPLRREEDATPEYTPSPV
eukprot:CAMPEP_0180142934 /NCGR_PEP_ID=MMETSP0986-20121125/15910_1 /TAXON_ID=697907 /ORGANISM="non described non described, Strain CCMP2293" /LENGTH=103 /DNA_ID=CAMNT_0022086295 /DNA_START=199 /DNA_END=510 /DNA_ORIENTATION=-